MLSVLFVLSSAASAMHLRGATLSGTRLLACRSYGTAMIAPPVVDEIAADILTLITDVGDA